MSAEIASISSFRTTAGTTVGTAADKKTFEKNPSQQNIQAERTHHISKKIANTNFSFSMGGTALTVSLTDSVSGEIFRKIVFKKFSPAEMGLDKKIGHLIDVNA
jgi:hypothetical protein